MDQARLALLTEFDAANTLSLSPGTLRSWRARGKGPVFVRLGRRIAYRLEDLEAFVRAGLTHGGPERG
ncbi:MAG: helix-turn-helix domain-containing protein [Bacteroidota bacterium]